MQQNYEAYATEHQVVWNRLFTRQETNLRLKGATIYNDSLQQMKYVLNADAIPRIDALNEALMAHNGWSIHIVPGLIPAGDFLRLLGEKKFCSSTWLRNMSQLDYLEEPDMFHDIFGHIPLLWNKEYADFVQQVGALGMKYAGNEAAIALLERFYWFTIEFGLVREQEQARIYGAGIISSFQETNSIFDGHASVQPFVLNDIAAHGFIKSELQAEYFLLDSFEQLYATLPELDENLKNAVVGKHAVSGMGMPAGPMS